MGRTCRAVQVCPHLAKPRDPRPAPHVRPQIAGDQSSYWPRSPRQRIFFRILTVGCPIHTFLDQPRRARLRVPLQNVSLNNNETHDASEEWRGWNRPRALLYGAGRTFEDIFDGRTDLVIVDFDHPVEQLLANSERLLAHDPNRSPIAERTNFGERDAFALLQAASHRVPVERLGTDDARARIADALDVFGYARGEAAAADGGKDGVEVLGVRELLEDLHTDGALARDHERVVVRRDKDETVRGGEARALDLGLVKVRAVQDDLGAEANRVAYFDRRRGLRHHDRARDAESCAGERDALRVVPWNEGRGGEEVTDGERSGLLGVYAGRARLHGLTGAACDDALPPLFLR